MEKPLVSIIITCYNQKKYIEDAVESVIAQTYPNWEAIIIDDGDENIEKYLLGYLQKYQQKIRVFKGNNFGSSKARNYGASLSDGKFLVFLDADDKIHPKYFEKAIKVFQENPNIDIVYPDTQHFGEGTGIWISPEYDFHNLTQGNFMVISSMIRRNAFVEVNGYDSNNFNYWEDWELWINLGAHGHYGKHLNEILFYYRFHQDGSSESERAQKLGIIYQSYIITKFPQYYGAEVVENAKQRLSAYPPDFMKMTPKQQAEVIIQKG
jgi:glycosyltransferase involved in cell wall biosynthesis